MPSPLHEVFDRLSETFGSQAWWPADSKFEIIVGAVLTQNTSWTNVEKAIGNLRDCGALSFRAMFALSTEELAEIIRPAGYYRLKAKRLRNLLDFMHDRFDGSIDDMFAATGSSSLREELLQVNGIGPETADSILLYAGEIPTFVVDTYTARLVKRHEWVEEDADYYSIKEFFESNLEQDVPLFNEYHALIVQLGKRYCKTKPKCDECPLCEWLPESSEHRSQSMRQDGD